MSDLCTHSRRDIRVRRCPQNAQKTLHFSSRFNLPISVLGAQSAAFGGHEVTRVRAMKQGRFQHTTDAKSCYSQPLRACVSSLRERTASMTEHKIFPRQPKLA